MKSGVRNWFISQMEPIRLYQITIDVIGLMFM